VLAENRNGSLIHYNYGADGISGFTYGGSEYIYRKNLQGDISHIYKAINNTLTLVGQYNYNAWGLCSITTNVDSIATINPIRYRGYYFDTETGFYYLQSRYYDPETGRFINADDLSYLNPQAVNGLNLYAYCGDNPVNLFDSTGCSPFWDGVKKALGWVAVAGLAIFTVAAVIASGGTLLIPVLIGAAIGATVSVVGQGIGNIASGKGFFEGISWQSVLMGAVAGAAFATGVGFWGAVAIGAVSNAGTAALENKSWTNIGLSFVVGGVAAGVGYGAGRLVGRAVFANSDLIFKDVFNLAIQDTGKVMASLIAMRATYYTFAPMLTTGMTRGLSKFLGNMGISWL
jgi:RHS repeat-associated protein